MENTRNTNEYAFGLIIDEMDGALTEGQKTELDQWISASPENKRIYSEFYDINHRLDVLSAERRIDVTESWKALEGKLEPANTVFIKESAANMTMKWIAMAASVLLIIAFGLYFSNRFTTEVVRTAANQLKAVQLPDGSTVTLNGNSELHYNKMLYKQSRFVTLLRGEAFFNVIHRPADKFTVDLGTARLTDLGTSFNVLRDGNDIHVVVSTGKVQFENKTTGDQLLLSPGMKGSYYARRKSLIKSLNADVNYKAWSDKKLTFNNTPLPRVAQLIGNVYGCSVILANPSLSAKTLSGKLDFKTADSALVVVKESLGLTMRRSGSQFVLDY
jgi:ferric-dicitrate binding protein FerR (iron transport regulator)